jgi:hypothetical protein
MRRRLLGAVRGARRRKGPTTLRGRERVESKIPESQSNNRSGYLFSYQKENDWWLSFGKNTVIKPAGILRLAWLGIGSLLLNFAAARETKEERTNEISARGGKLVVGVPSKRSRSRRKRRRKG